MLSELTRYKSIKPRQIIKNALRGFLISAVVIIILGSFISFIFHMSQTYDNTTGNAGYAMAGSLLIAAIAMSGRSIGWPWSTIADPYFENLFLHLFILSVAVSINIILVSILIPILKELVNDRKRT